MHGVIDVDDIDFNDDEKLGSGKAKVDRLSKIIGIFQRETLDFSKNRAEGDDLIGDAYEYLMRNFATQSGKSKGQFYTPSEVSQVIAKVIGAKNAKKQDWTVYDPTAGSGSLLLKVANETPRGITIYGQENDVATRAMAMMNMWIHNYETAEIKRENTLSNPLWIENKSLKEFDFVVANPPFSFKSWDSGIDPENDQFERFSEYGIPPKNNGDFAFLLHIIKSLKNTGKGAIVLPHGVLFRVNVEERIRKKIVDEGLIKGIISLPTNMFYGTGIPACIIVIDKENAKSRKGIFMINANKGFVKDGNKNRLRAQDIHKIVDCFTKQLEISKFSRLVPKSEISNEDNNYNLNISRYIDNQEEEDQHNILGHLKGGIPSEDIDKLNDYWKMFPNIKKELFVADKKPNYEILKIEKSKIEKTVFGHYEFNKFLTEIEKLFLKWKSNNFPLLNDIQIGSHPKKIINGISENILEVFSNLKIVDKYSIYQLLMSYWEETMQDDTYLISLNGWDVSLYPIKDKNEKEKGWESELLPKNIVIKKFFSKEKNKLEDEEDKLESISQEMQIMIDEQEGDDDLFSDVKNESNKITKGDLQKRISQIKNDPEFSEELKILSDYNKLYVKQSDLKKQIKELHSQLDENLYKKYQKLTKNEIKELVINEKWFFTIHNLIDDEIERISNKLSGRIKELQTRYETPLEDISNNLQIFSKKINGHLKVMGFQ